MFVFDFAVSVLLEELMDWLYKYLIEFISYLLSLMNEMGVDLFRLSWVNAIEGFFDKLAWSLFVVGIVVAVFEFAMEFQNGRGNPRELAFNILKGFLAASLFSIVPVRLYEFSVLQAKSVGQAITGLGTLDGLAITWSDMENAIQHVGNGMIFFELFVSIMIIYALVKVFFANLKRGGILLTQIAVGSLYMFSIPRGYIDSFTSWCKQVIGICLTSFLQTVILVAGLMTIQDKELLGLGLMLASTEVPRIAGQFGLDTTTKANMMGGVYAVNMAVNLAKTIATVVA